MTRGVWIVAWVLVAVWSLAALVGYGVIDLFGTFAVERADLAARDPDQVAWIAWFFETLRDLGLFAVGALWLLVSAAILGVAALVAKATRDRERFTDARR
jgi:ABC-type Na+ efflux pump permease subunit